MQRDDAAPELHTPWPDLQALELSDGEGGQFGEPGELSCRGVIIFRL
jgi:hypothetical protein